MADKANESLKKNVELVNQAEKSYTELFNQLTKNVEQMKGLTTTTIELNKQLNTTSVKAFNQAQKELKANIKNVELAERENIKTTSLLKKENEKLAREQLKTAQAKAKVANAAKRLNGEYQKASRRLTELRNNAKNVALQFGVNSKEFRKAATEVNKLDTQLKSIDSRLGQNQRSVGNYSKALGGLKNILGAAGIVGGFQLFFNVLRNGLKIQKDFEKGNAVLAGILGKTRKEITALTDDARRLGATTAKSATEVTKLQEAYARLGFSQSEILDLTGDTINGSIALNAELAETAELTGAVVRTFDDLGTTDAGTILDQLTLSTQKSALNFEKLQTALPIVAGAANTAGISFTKLLSLLGKLSDSGIDASSSATALRNIFIESAAQGLNYEQILQKIADNQDKLTAANDEFGKRAAVSATILSKNIKGVNDLDKALQNAGGTAEKVANEQLNTLDGQLKLLNSAWEGFILAINDGDKAIGRFAKGTITFLTNAINGLTTLGSRFELVFKGIEDASDDAIQSLIDFGEFESGDKMSEKLDELTEKFNKLPDAAKQAITFNQFLQQSIRALGEDFDTAKRLADFYEQSLNQVAETTSQVVEETNNASGAMINANNEILTAAQGISELPKNLAEEVAATFKKTDLEIAATQLKGVERFKQQEEEKTRILKEQAALRKETELAATEGAFEAAGILSDQFFSNAQMRRDNETQLQIDALNQRLENENLDAEQRELLQEQINKKQKKLKQDQAKADKRAAIVQSIINTALSVSKTAATLGFPAAIPFIAFATITGAAQTAAIASQPIPQFDKGTKSAPGTGFIAGEKRDELMVHKGQVSLIDKPTLFGSEYKGAEIIGGSETARIIDQINRGQVIENIGKYSNVDQQQIQIAVGKEFGKHADRMIAEMKKNRPIAPSSFDKHKVTMDYIKKHAE